GQLRAGDDADVLTLARTERRGGLARVAVTGDEPHTAPVGPTTDWSARPPVSLAALATRTHDALRVLVIHHQNRPVPDRAPIQRELARSVTIAFDGLAPGAWQVRHLDVGGNDGSTWQGTQSTDLRWQDDGCTTATDGRLALTARRMEANVVWLFEARRRAACTPPSRAPS